MKMIRLLPLLTALVLAGCSPTPQVTVSYDSTANQTTYTTRAYTVASSSGADFASAKSISAKAIARCAGSDCTPSMARLIFRVDGNQKFYLSSVSGNIVANGTRIEWSSAEANRDFANLSSDRAVRVSGKFATVDLQFDELKTIATASSIDGKIGGKSLNLSAGLQSGLQRLVQKTSGPTSSGSAETKK